MRKFVAIRIGIAGALLIVASSELRARTIELTDTDADKIAVIGAEAPLQGWAAFEAAPGMFTTQFVSLRARAAALIRVPLDRIPAGNRITKAEWVIPVEWANVPEPHIYVWRIIGDWGIGACYKYRQMRPQPVEWAMPGARGNGTDRADQPTIVVQCKTQGDVTVNVTADVDLWYSGAAPNTGWMFTVEDDILLRLSAPSSTTRGCWKLRITYEPQ